MYFKIKYKFIIIINFFNIKNSLNINNNNFFKFNKINFEFYSVILKNNYIN